MSPRPLALVAEGIACAGIVDVNDAGSPLLWEWRHAHKALGLKKKHWEIHQLGVGQPTFDAFGLVYQDHVGKQSALSSEMLVSTTGWLVLVMHVVIARQSTRAKMARAVGMLGRLLELAMLGFTAENKLQFNMDVVDCQCQPSSVLLDVGAAGMLNKLHLLLDKCPSLAEAWSHDRDLGRLRMPALDLATLRVSAR